MLRTPNEFKYIWDVKKYLMINKSKVQPNPFIEFHFAWHNFYLVLGTARVETVLVDRPFDASFSPVVSGGKVVM